MAAERNNRDVFDIMRWLETQIGQQFLIGRSDQIAAPGAVHHIIGRGIEQ